MGHQTTSQAVDIDVDRYSAEKPAPRAVCADQSDETAIKKGTFPLLLHLAYFLVVDFRFTMKCLDNDHRVN